MRLRETAATSTVSLRKSKLDSIPCTSVILECAGNTNNEKEVLQVLLNKGDPGGSSHKKHCRWMAHWSKSSSNMKPQDGKSCSPLEDANNATCMKNSRTSPSEPKKSRLAERLMVAVNHERASVEHAEWYSNMWGVAHDACQELDQQEIEQGDGNFWSSMMKKQKDMNLYAKTVVSKAFSFRRLSELSLEHFQNPVNSDNLNSEWSNFPMFAINKKIDSILNPKRRPTTSTMCSDLIVPKQIVKLNKVTSEYEHQTHRIVDEIIDQCKPAGGTGTTSRLEDPISLNSDPARKILKTHLPIMESCSCSKDDSHSSSDCLMDEHLTSNHFANTNPHCVSNEKNILFVENNNKDEVSAFRLGKEFDTEPHNYFKNSKQDDENFHGSHRSHGRVVESHLLSDKHHYLNTHRMESSANVIDFYMLPDPTANTLAVNSKGDAVSHERYPMDKFTDSSKRKGPCLFEMLTISSKPQCVYPKDSLPLEKSTGLGVCMYGTNIGSHLFRAQNQPSVKTETFYRDVQHVSKSTAGIASSSMAQKNNGCSKKANSEQLASLSMERAAGHNKEKGLCKNEHQDGSSEATIASKQGCRMPGSESMDLDLMLFQISRMRNQLSDGAIQSRGHTEPSDRWLKRFQVDIADPHIRVSKRSKIGETSGIFGMACHHEVSDSDMVNRVKENHVLDQGIKLQSIQERSHVPSKTVNSWLRRWCQGDVPVPREDPDDRKLAAKPELASEELEAQFPSITAMAMMGRAMSKVRPCDHKRKGPFVVWNTARD